MASDYGDDAGEKMIEDFMRFGERMGERAMYDRAAVVRSTTTSLAPPRTSSAGSCRRTRTRSETVMPSPRARPLADSISRSDMRT
ncbi:hypothetical protein DMP06_10335 [Slackia equolifaciens]|uniref:Uncharacterized protein n=1 Tax=Slackia equolifaciens TaxID=498718 RepID=A0A3N0AT05_9ACTN|nr:hypothetical protein DMP06_10335 [Slackia equolifaciens]